MLVQSELVASEIIINADQPKKQSQGPTILCLHFLFIITYVHLWMAYYFCKWPNTNRIIWPYVLIPTFSYFELCILTILLHIDISMLDFLIADYI